jgi:predicted nucleic acid-binding protein
MRLLDTTVAVDHLRGFASATELLGSLIETGEEVAASELTRFELIAGVRPREIAALEDFFLAVIWAPVTASVARRAGELARRFRRSHTGIDAVDYLIAATALELGAELLTTNTRHFPMLHGLEAAY